MQNYAQEIMRRFPIRRKAEQKQAFRDWVVWELKEHGFSPHVDEDTSGDCCNVTVGDPGRAKLILAAHYDTAVRELIPGFLAPTRPVAYLASQALIAAVFIAAAFLLAFGVTFALDAPGATLPMFLLLMFAVLAYPKFGPANKSNANDNTSGVAAVMEIAAALSPRVRGEVAIVFLDRGTDGMKGARRFAKKYAEVLDTTPVMDFDCVGNGDTLLLFVNKLARWNVELLDAMTEVYTDKDGKHALVRSEGLFYFPSDNRKLHNHVMVCAVRHTAGFGYTIGRLRRATDTVLDEKNIEYLQKTTLKLIEIYCK